MKNFFDDFKPIRNILRGLNLWKVLDELYWTQNKKRQNILPEVIEFIYLNSIVYSLEYNNIRIKDKQNKWDKIVIQSNVLLNKVNALWIEQKGPWSYLQKGGLNQLKSGTDDYFSHIYRYYYIFSKEPINAHIESKIGMAYKDFLICAMWLHSIFTTKGYFIPKSYFLQNKFNGTVFSIENVTRVLDILSIPYEKMKSTLKIELKYDINTFITHDYIHLKKPIFEKQDILYCLFGGNLLDQFTSGVYYLAEIYDNKYDLGNAFGGAFEDYVGLILDKNKNSDKFRIVKEIVYNNTEGEHKTSDWIIETENAIIFIECKTTRLLIESKKVEDIHKSDKDKIAKAVVQIYKCYSEYINNVIPNLKYDPNKTLIPIVLTLEEWYGGTPDFKDEIISIVKSKLKEKNFDYNLVDIYKYSHMSISNFETDIQIMANIGFKDFFERNSNNKDEFNYRPYFQEEFEQIFIKPLENQNSEQG